MSEGQGCLCGERESSMCCCWGHKLKVITLLIILVLLLNELNKSWKSSLEIEGDLKENMEKAISQRDSLFSELQKLKGENQNLAEKLKNAEAALQMERANKENPEATSSALLGPQIYSLLLGLCLTIALFPWVAE